MLGVPVGLGTPDPGPLWTSPARCPSSCPHRLQRRCHVYKADAICLPFMSRSYGPLLAGRVLAPQQRLGCPKLGHTSATRRLGAAHPAPTNHSGIFTASVGPRPTRRRRRCSLGGTRCSSEVRAPAQRVTGVERPAARMAGEQSGTAPGGVARPARWAACQGRGQAFCDP